MQTPRGRTVAVDAIAEIRQATNDAWGDYVRCKRSITGPRQVLYQFLSNYASETGVDIGEILQPYSVNIEVLGGF